jgi:hypothetical protein
MPLYDHFHGRIADRPWESFHGQWANCIAADLNRRLPKHLVADAPMYVGTRVSADVAEYERLEENGRQNGEHANNNLMVGLAEYDDRFLMPDDSSIYVTAYRPVSRKKKDLIDLWMWALAVGSGLPAVPFALKGFGCVRLDLEATYKEACERNRIPE